MNRGVPRTPFVAVCLLLLAGCATQPVTDKDPWERVNRAVHGFNTTLDNAIAKPAAKGYVRTVGQPVRDIIGNFLSNWSYPLVVANDILQGKFKQAGADTGRFLLNTTFGLAGILDPATEVGLDEHDEDFGQTLALWGVPSGPFIMLPFLGPNTVRDATAGLFQAFFNPLVFTATGELRIGILLLAGLDARSRLLGIDEAIAQAYDPYTFIRDSYWQRRLFIIYDGDLPEDELYEEFDDFEDDEFYEEE